MDGEEERKRRELGAATAVSLDLGWNALILCDWMQLYAASFLFVFIQVNIFTFVYV